MDSTFLISALSLFAGAAILPAGILLLRDRDIPIDRQHHVRGIFALIIALVLIGTGILFLLNVIAQDVGILLLAVGLVVILPLTLIQVDKMRK